MKNTQFKSTIAEINDIPTGDSRNPFLTVIKFIFADNQGNENKQGIEEEDFDSIIQSAVHMPIKINYAEGDLKGHILSVPIGHITSMVKSTEDNIPQLLGEAVLYNQEYPEEVKFLKDKHAEAEAPGISWELAYSDSIVKNGIEWLKQAITVAATFVKKPAYGKRTALLAIAQAQTDDSEFMQQLQGFIETWADKKKVEPPEIGGTKKVEEELKKAQAELEAAQARITALETEVTEVKARADALAVENEQFKKEKTLAERLTKISEAGIKFELNDEELKVKHTYWLSMSQEQFDAYLSDLKVVAAKPKAAEAATKEKTDLPRFVAVAGQETSIDDLKSVARRASRGDVADL